MTVPNDAFVNRRPMTIDELTDAGEEMFESHVVTLEALIEDLEDA